MQELVRPRARFAAAVLVALVVVAVVAGALQLWRRPPAQAMAHRVTLKAPVVAAAEPEPSPAAAAPNRPAPAARTLTGPRLVIPSINVNAKIESVGVDRYGDMGVPTSPWDVGWYEHGPQPGQPGDAVLDGHLDWWTTGPAVFWNLGKVQVGDRIEVVRPNAPTATFVVASVATYAYTAHPPGLFAASGPPRISLITCAGTWDASHANYLQRLVVTARLATA